MIDTNWLIWFETSSKQSFLKLISHWKEKNNRRAKSGGKPVLSPARKWVGDNGELWTEGPLAVVTGSIPDAWARLWESIPNGGIPCSAVMQERGAWSCPNSMYQTLLTLHGSPCLLRGVDQGLAGVRQVKAGGGMGGRIVVETQN